MMPLKAIIFLILLSCPFISWGQEGTIKSATQDFSEPYSPLGSVPDWVETKTTPQEYALWEKLSEYFRIDYSILRQPLSQAQKEKLYESIAATCKAIANGSYSAPTKTPLTFHIPPATDTSIQWNVAEKIQIDEHIRYEKVEGIVLKPENGDNVAVKSMAWYIYNSKDKSVYLIKDTLLSTGQDARINAVQTFYYDKEGQKLCGSCAGTLTFLDNQNKWRSVDFNKSYDFPVDKGNSIKE